jgi:hypothetical protein
MEGGYAHSLKDSCQLPSPPPKLRRLGELKYALFRPSSSNSKQQLSKVRDIDESGPDWKPEFSSTTESEEYQSDESE